MQYQITSQSILITDNNRRKNINFDEIMAPYEQQLITMIVIEKKSFEDISKFVDDIQNNHKSSLTVAPEVQITTQEKLKAVDLSEDELLNFSKGQIKIVDSNLYWRGEKVNNKKLLDFISHYKAAGTDLSFIERFMEKLYSNPNQRARDDIFNFIVNRCGIMDDGDFLAYKRVKSNYYDCHSGTMDNSIGKRVFMDRSKCDSNPKITCSRGLHVCTKGYLSSFGGDRIVLCKVNPKNVVAIPDDYNAMKMRTCDYVVIGEIKNQNEFSDILKSLYENPKNISFIKKDLNEENSTEVLNNIGQQNPTPKIMVIEDLIKTLKEIFSNDSKMLASFKAGENLINGKGITDPKILKTELEQELLSRATKMRPNNSKFKALILSLTETVDNTYTSDTNENTTMKVEGKVETNESAIQSIKAGYFDQQVEKHLMDIFSTDSKTLASFKAGKNIINNQTFASEDEKAQALDNELLTRAKKLRPNNTRLNAFILQYAENKTKHDESNKPAVETIIPTSGNIDELIQTFSTDTKVAKALEKIESDDEEGLFNSMIEKIQKIRPNSAKLKSFLDKFKI